MNMNLSARIKHLVIKYLVLSMVLLNTLNFISCKGDKEAATSTPDPTTISKLNQFFERTHKVYLERHPITAAYLGQGNTNDSWEDLSDRFAKEDSVLTSQYLDTLLTFDTTKLDEESKTSYILFKYNADRALENFKYRYHKWVVNTQGGVHTDVPTFLMNIHKIENEKDAQDYIARVSKVNLLMRQSITQMQRAEKLGIVPALFVYPKVLQACTNVTAGAPYSDTKSSNILVRDFMSKVNKVPALAASKSSLLASLAKAMDTSLAVGYASLTAELQRLQTKADSTVGIVNWKDGKALYSQLVKDYTTTNMTPEQVFAFGEKEVARIHEEIKGLMTKLGFKGSIKDFFQFMTDPKNAKSFYPNTAAGRARYLKEATGYIDTMRTKLPSLFTVLPKAPIVVMAVEKFRESSAGTAFYEAPTLDGSRPGRFYANLYDMNQSPVYQLEALAYHEGIPGHHMQIAISQELSTLPSFRKIADYTAYIEGWALYTELIPKEIGLYQDVYSDFGRLSMELLRAARCVVDPGIHYFGWGREKAIQYFIDNTAEPAGECVNAIERYITWPGQATAYMVGKDKILSQRERAKKEMGASFDIRKFHDMVLTGGAVPLSILEQRVNKFIASSKSTAAAN